MGFSNFSKVPRTITLLMVAFALLAPRTCHTAVLLNELNADNPGTDAEEYIELYNTADQAVSLENYIVVLYNGNGETAYEVITFSSSSSISAKGFYVIGSTNVVPPPDVLLGDTNIIQNGIDAVALYFGDTSKFTIGMSVTNDSLVDAIVYDNGGDHDDSKLIDVLTPGQRTLHEDSGGDDVDESLSRCVGTDPLTLSQFLLTPHTPGSSNDCAPTTIILNELNSDNPGTDQAEFIELYNTADSVMSLDNYVLVFYNGNDDNKAYLVIALNGSIPGNGYYVIGSALVDPMPDQILPGDEHILQNGVDAVALYYGSPSLYTVGMIVTTDNLVDAIVYDKSGGHSDTLTNILTPGELTLHEDDDMFDFPDESLGRCTGNDPRILSQYWVGPITPGSDNNCSFPNPTALPTTPRPVTSAAVLLNELNADNPGTDGEEYIELYNTADQAVSLENYVVVLYNGNGETAYEVITFGSSSSIAAKGFYVIGSSNVVPPPDVLLGDTNIIQNGIDAVALYFGDTSKYTIGMSVTNDSLVDAIVYDNGGDHDDSKLIDVLTPGQRTLHEDSGGDDVDESLSRCVGTDPLTLSQFLLTPHTPGSSNDCAPTTVILNELNSDNPGTDQAEFIELYNTADSVMSLDNYVLVFYNGNDDNKAYLVIALNGSIPGNGYYVIGSALVDPMPDQILPGDEHILQNGVDAVALYYGSSSLYTVGMTVTTDNLVDAIVYDKSGGHSDTLTNILTPGELTLHEDDDMFDFPDESLGRCTGNDPRILSQYWVGPITPGSDNNCSFPNPTAVPTTPRPVTSTVLLNELNADNPGTDGEEYIELYNTADQAVSLENYVVVLYNGNGETAYEVITFGSSSSISAKGFYVIGSSNVVPAPDVLLGDTNIIQNGIDAVALYFGDTSKYTIGMSVTNDSLVDAIVYDNGGDHDDSKLIDVLTPGQRTLHEDSGGDDVDESLSRCVGTDPLTLSQFLLTPHTPGSSNDCAPTTVILNELNSDNPGTDQAEFIELYNTADSVMSLDNYVLVFYNGNDDNKAYLVIALNGSIPGNGYYVIGSALVDPMPDQILPGDEHILQNGVDAVALYYGSPSLFTVGMTVTTDNLVDAIVYDNNGEHSDTLTNILTPGEQTLHENDFFYDFPDESLGRCTGNDPRILSQYWLGPITPGSENNCSFPNPTQLIPTVSQMSTLPETSTEQTTAPGPVSSPVIINELNADNPGTDDQEFVELFNTGDNPIQLDNYILVFYTGSSDTAYAVVQLPNGQSIPAGGHFVVGSSNVNPTPDLILSGSISVQNGEDAVALYYGNPSRYSVGMYVTNSGLVDAIVYDNSGQHDDTLTDVLTPGEETLHEDSNHLANDESLSRCGGTDPLKLSQYALTAPTPGTANLCNSTLPSTPTVVVPTLDPALQPDVVINEFDVDAANQFIELYDGGVGGTALDGLVLVLYDGLSSTVYWHYDLNGYKTGPGGYFGVGTSQPNWTPDIALMPDIIKRDGINAIALYYTPASNVSPGTAVTNQDLADALVYSSTEGDFSNHPLTSTLTPGQDVLTEDESISQEEGSFSRCRGWRLLLISSFMQTTATPSSSNNCTLPAVVLNEVNVAQSGQTVHNYEFIELYDGGIGRQSLDGVLVVFYNGNGDVSYLTIDCTGYSTDADGYLIIAADVDSTLDPDITVPYNPQGFIQNGPDAVALHLAPPQQFPTSTPVTDINLIDAVVYGTNDNPDLQLLDALLPGQHQVNENSNFKPEDHSISRCECCQSLNSSAFGLGPVTPRGLSVNCTRNNETVTETVPVLQDLLRIYEVNADQEGDDLHEFIELGSPYKFVSLDGIVVVLYSGGDDRSYRTFDLTGYQTNDKGLFVIGSTAITPTPDIVVSQQAWIQNGPDAVALYKGVATDFPMGTYVTDENLLDAVVYGTNDKMDQELLDVLSPGQDQINEDWDHHTGDESIIRCYSNNAIDLMAFTLGHPSPGALNTCPLPPLVVNEINVDQAGADKAEYIELRSLDRAGFPLNNLVVVLYNGKTDLSYRSVGIDGHRTDNNGLFLIGSDQVSVVPDLIINAPADGFIQNGPDAVALYSGTEADFPDDTFATNDSLIDAIVYATDGDPPAQSLVDILTPGGEQVIEDDRFHYGDESINRCDGDAGDVRIVVSHLSPKMKNICPLSGNVSLIVNEAGVVQNNNFIEIWDDGYGEALLDGYVIVVYNDNDESVITFDLTGYTTNQQGYFVVGSDSVQPGMVVDQDFLPMLNGGIGVYRAPASQFPNGTSATAENIVDALVYSQQGNSADSLAEVLLGTQAAEQVNSDAVQTGSNTISRCLSGNTRDSAAHTAGVSSPASLNKCPVYNTDIIISELNADQPGDDDREFIELYDGGRGNSLLSYLTLVMYNGGGLDSSYMAVNLDGYSTNSDGYLVIGSSNVQPAADIVLSSENGGFLQNGPDAIAIYRAPTTAFPYGTPVTDVSLLDALVYSTNDQVDQVLLDTLTPGGNQVKETADATGNDQSISRCYGNTRFDTSSYILAAPTPKANNSCPSPPPPAEDIIINELNADSPATDTHEFIELYDKGVGNTPLDGLILVFFNGADDDKSYFELDLNGYKTNSNGYFVIGSDNVVPQPDIIVDFSFLQNGPDAAVLYNANLADFPRGTMATSDNMVDCIVYGTNDDQDETLIAILAPGQIQVNENDGHLSQDESLSRCLSDDVVNLFAYIVSEPTPGSANNCTLSTIVINELNVDQPGVDEKEFIELYDGGRGYTSLDSLIVVLFNGQDNDKSYSTIPLQNYRTDGDGYFVIGAEGVTDYVDIIIDADNGFLQNGADAIAVYRDDPRNFPDGTLPTQENLVDALVYGTSDNRDDSLVDALLPGQHQVDESADFMDGDESISRCICCEALQASAFGLGHPSPRGANNCTADDVYTPPPPVTVKTTPPPSLPPVVINEVNPDNPSYDTREFIELYGPAGTDLSNLVVVLYNGNLDPPTSYYAVGLEGQQLDTFGFLVIGSVNMSPPPDVSLPDQDSGIIQNGADAVALYMATVKDFPNGTPVTDKNLIDALVYTNDRTKTSQALLDVLTPNYDIFVEDDSWHGTQDESISRCSCCDNRTPGVYALSFPSPGTQNNCPSEDYARDIQMRLVDADCETWLADDRYMNALIDEIVAGVEEGCQCGFTPVYLQDSKVFCGSVVYQATMLAMNEEQRAYLVNNYTRYITETEEVEILGERYAVDNQCVWDCVPDPEAVSQGLSGGAIAGIVIGVLVAVVLVLAIAVFVIKRRKDGYDRYAFDDGFKISNACELDSIAGGGNMQSFDNPAYEFGNSKY